MTSYILRRLIAVIPTLLIVGVVSFALVHITPGDPAVFILGPEASEESLASLRERLGLGDPFLVQLGSYFSRLARLDLGNSLFTGVPVIQTIASRLEPTVLLILCSIVVAIVIGMPIGIIGAVYRNTPIDQTLLVLSLFAVAMPNFWLGLNLILVFAVQFGVLPVAGYAPLSADPMATLRFLTLPMLALGLSQAAIVSRITRTSMLEVLSQDFIRTARSKGLSGLKIILKHALKNALIPVITIVGTIIAALLGGAIVIEVVFNLPGLGRVMITAVQRRDYPVVQGVLLFVTFANVILHIGIDIVYAYIDPRIEYA